MQIINRLNNRVWWIAGTALIVTLFLGSALVREWETLISFRWQFRWVSIIALVTMHTFALSTLFIVWHLMIVRFANIHNWRLNLNIYSLTVLSRRIPLPVWYVGSRMVLYRKVNVPMGVTLTATSLEAALIAIAGVIFYFALFPWYTYAQDIPWWLFVVLGLFLVIIFAVHPGVVKDLINLILKIFKKQPVQVEIQRNDLLLWCSIYLGTWLLDGLGLYFMTTAILVEKLPIAGVLGVSTVSALVAMTSLILPGGLGLKELAMGAMLSPWVPLSVGLVISIVYRGIYTFVEMMWAYVGHFLYQKSGGGAQNNPN